MTYAVRTEDLGKRFGDTEALAGLNLNVAAGTVLGLLGHNGAGKTTAVRILTTLALPTAGRAFVAGHDVVRSPAQARANLSLAGQQASLDERLTGRENLRLLGRLLKLSKGSAFARADELLARFGIEHAADRQVGTYSGGMRRRLDLAACLVVHRPVVFLDEPTTGLDPRGRLALWQLLGELTAAGTSLLLTTQYIEEAERLAETIVILDHGRVIASGTPGQLRARAGGDGAPA